MPTAASNDQTYRSLPCPNGWRLSAGRCERRRAVSSSTSVTGSPPEWAASDSSAADPVNRPASALRTAMPTLAARASTTVSTLSEDTYEAEDSAMSSEDGRGLGPGQRPAVPGERAATRTLQSTALDEPAGVDRRAAQVADQPGDHPLGRVVVPGEEERERFGVFAQRTQGRDRQVVERLDHPCPGQVAGDHLAGGTATEGENVLPPGAAPGVRGIDDDLPGQRTDPGDRIWQLCPPHREDDHVRAGQLRRGDRRRPPSQLGDQVGQRLPAA